VLLAQLEELAQLDHRVHLVPQELLVQLVRLDLLVELAQPVLLEGLEPQELQELPVPRVIPVQLVGQVNKVLRDSQEQQDLQVGQGRLESLGLKV